MPKKQEPKEEPKEEGITLKKTDFDALLKRMEGLENQNKMLVEVADKGRVMDYETRKSASDKKPVKVKLPVHGGGIVIKHLPIKDTLLYGPIHGNPIGEQQEYKITILMPDNAQVEQTVQSYSRFSSVRYDERVEVEVIGRREDERGELFYTLRLPDGRDIEVGTRFVN